MKKQRKAEEMDLIISAYERSGQGVREFCASAGIAEHLLRYWMKRRATGELEVQSGQGQGFSELKISTGSAGCSIVLPHGLRLGIEGMAARELACLLLELDRQQDA
jgi:transposase-like protein